MMKLSYENGKPIYEQIAQYIKYEVTKGYLRPGDSILSVRKMALELGITPNTVAKAYQLLEQDGIIQTLPGRGTYIKEFDLIPQDATRISEAENGLKSIILELKLMGIKKEEILKTVDEIYEELSK